MFLVPQTGTMLALPTLPKYHYEYVALRFRAFELKVIYAVKPRRSTKISIPIYLIRLFRPE